MEGEQLRLLAASSVYEFVAGGLKADRMESLPYDPIYRGESEWRLLAPIDHPEPARCLISGTGPHPPAERGQSRRDASGRNGANG